MLINIEFSFGGFKRNQPKSWQWKHKTNKRTDSGKKWLKSVSCDCAVRELAELNPWGIELLSSLCLETVELQFLLEYFRVEFLQLLCNHFLFCGNILSANFDDINQSNWPVCQYSHCLQHGLVELGEESIFSLLLLELLEHHSLW